MMKCVIKRILRSLYRIFPIPILGISVLLFNLPFSYAQSQTTPIGENDASTQDTNSSQDLPETSNVNLTITLEGTGQGSVTGSMGQNNTRLDCGTQCTADYTTGQSVTLTALPAETAEFAQWSGDCAGTESSLTLLMDQDKHCTATFTLLIFPSSLTNITAYQDGLNGIDGLQGASSVTLSPDGQFVYATGFTDNAVAVFSRVPSTGLLSFQSQIKEGVNNVKNLQGANAIVVSPDNKNVYVTASNSNALVVFNRDLTLLQFQEDGVNSVDHLAGASALAISPDGLRVYVVATRDHALTAFSREPATGLLTFLTSQQNGLNGVVGLGGATSVATTHNIQGPTDIYVASGTDNQLTAFRRDSALGELIFLGNYPVTTTERAYGIVVSPDDQHVYLATRNTLIAYTRDPTTGNLNSQGKYTGPLSGLMGFTGSPLAIHPNGQELYATSLDDDSLTVFQRDPQTGSLVLKTTLHNNTGTLNTLDGPMGVAISPDGNHLYTTALQSHALTLFSNTLVDLQLTATASTNTVALTQPLTYTLTLTNQGNDTATNINLTHLLPNGTTLNITPVPSQGSCSPPIEQELNCSLGNLAPNSTLTLNLTLTAPTQLESPAQLIYTASVTSAQPDRNPVDNQITLTTALVETLPDADLKLSLTTQLAQDITGLNIPYQYLLTAKNNGPNPVTGAVLTGTLPAALDTANTDQRCQSTASQTFTCNLGNLSLDAETQLTLAIITPASPDLLNFTAHISSNETDPTPTDNQVTHQLTVIESVDVDLEIVDVFATPDTLPIKSQQPIVYTVTVRNNHPELPATGVVLSTTQPWPAKQLKYIESNANCSLNTTGHLNCPLGTVAALVSQVVEIQAKPLESANDIPIEFTVSGSGTDSISNNNTKTAHLGVSGQVANLSVTIAADEEEISLNQLITYTVTVTNTGPNIALVGLDLQGMLSQGDLLLETPILNTGGTCQAGSSSTSFTCQLLTLPINGSAQLLIKAVPKSTGTLTLSAQANVLEDAFDPYPDNNTVQQQTTVLDKSADLAINLLVASALPVLKNNDLILEALISNLGPNEATGIQVTFNLPLSFTFQSAASDRLAGECTETVTDTERQIICPVSPISALFKDETFTIRLTVTPKEGGELTATADIASQLYDPSLTNNHSTLFQRDEEGNLTPLDSITISQFMADLKLTLEPVPDPVVGNPLPYTLKITNQGPDPANAVQLTHQLPSPEQAIYRTATFSPDTGNLCYDLSPNGELVCTLAQMPRGSTVTLNLELQPMVAGTQDFTATVTPTAEFDPDLANNTVSTTDYVNRPEILFFAGAEREGVKNVTGLQGVIALALSPDGNHLYAAGFNSNAITVFKRDPGTGQLTFVQALFDDTEAAQGLASPTDIIVSPEGNFIYVTSLNDSALTVFKRDSLTGQLTFVEIHQDGVLGVDGLTGAFNIAMTSTHLYVAGSGDDAIALFNRNALTGQLNFIGLQQDASLDGVNALHLSPDGNYWVSANANTDSLTLFQRDAGTGELTFLQNLVNQQSGILGLDAATDVIFSPDGLYLYSLGAGIDNAVTAFVRSPESDAFTFVESHAKGNEGVEGLDGPTSLTLTQDGAYLYITSANDSTLAIWKRQAETGHLIFLDSVRNGEKDLSGLGGAQDVVVSPNGTHIYVAGFSDNAISLLRMASSDLRLQISDSKDVVNVGENYAYTLTLSNDGPNPATQVFLEATLPASMQLVNIPNNSENCNETAEHTVLCKWKILEVGATINLHLEVLVNDFGEVTLQAIAAADQVDPTPAIASQTTRITATADLNLSAVANPSGLSIGEKLTYHITVTNNGPHDANDLLVTTKATGPSTLLISNEINGVADRCYPNLSSTEMGLTCPIAAIKTGNNALITLIIEPQTEGELTQTISVSSLAFDPVLPNNQTTITTLVTLNTIDSLYDNTNKTLRNYIITATGEVRGGRIAGHTVNQGILRNVHILPDTLVTGGGRLGGQITSEGIIEDAQLLAGTVITGGTVRGEIIGDPEQPATLNARIEAGTRLSHVIIAVGSTLDPKAILGEGVRFMGNVTIPAGLDLTGALSGIFEPIGARKAVNLQQDVLIGELDLLSAINALPDLKNNALVFTQDPLTGNLQLLLGEDLFVLVPTYIHQTHASDMPGITIYPHGQVIFITATGRMVTTQPSIQVPTAFQAALETLGLAKFRSLLDGNLQIAATEQLYFQARPDWQTHPSDPLKLLGLEAQPSSLVKGIDFFVLRFAQADGQRREQWFYPAPAQQMELETTLKGIPGATEVKFYNNGMVTVKIDGYLYRGVFDYVIERGPAQQVTQLLLIADQNEDGQVDLRITYANGDKQRLFLLPSPPLAGEIQAIPTVQEQRYTVTQDGENQVRLEQLLTRWFLKITQLEQLSTEFSPTMTVYPDGSVLFITPNGQQVRTQPLVQDFNGLQNTLRSLGLPNATVQGNGNLMVPFNAQWYYVARPGLSSQLAWLTLAPGLYNIPTSLPAVISLLFVFRDEFGNKRQQFIYPVAKEPENIYRFFMNAPGVYSVVMSNEGMLTVEGTGDIRFRGILDYTVERGGLATGGIQFSQTTDINADSLEDFVLIYGNGDKQIIYQLPF